MADETDPELIAAALVEALGDCIETLQRITLAGGKDDADDFKRACNAIDGMRKLACDALRRHGFTPRRSDPNSEAVALHESCHVIVARKLGLPVIHATAADGDPHVRIRFQRPEDDALVALAGLAADYSSEACAKDLQNGTRRVEGIVGARCGIALDAALPDAQRAEVTETVARLREKAKDLVETNWNAVVRVANALAKGGTLDQVAIDSLIGAK